MPSLKFPILDAIKKIVECNYKSFFKGAIALIALALIGASQTATSYIEADYKAKEIIFQIEASENNIFKSINCTDLNLRSQVDCKLATYLQHRNDLFFNLTIIFVCLSLAIATILLYLSVVGFLDAAKTLSKQTPQA